MARLLFLAFLLTSLFTTATARAQFPDLGELQAQMLPAVAVDVPEVGPDTTIQVSSYDASANAPIALGRHTFFIIGASYHAESIAYRGFPSSSHLGAFHAVELPLMLVALLPDDWALAFRVAPGMAGDLAACDLQALRASSVLMATHTFGPELTMGFGGMLNYGFGELLPLPALYLSFAPSSWMTFEVFAPAFARVTFAPAPWLELGVRADVAGNAYAVRDDRVREAWPCRADARRPADPERCLDHVAYSVVTVGLTAAVRLHDPLWLGAAAGRTVYRRFDAKNADGGDVDAGQDLANDWFVRASLTVRLPKGD